MIVFSGRRNKGFGLAGSRAAMRGIAAALLVCLLAVGAGHAQGVAPFSLLAGEWAGSGTIELSSAREPIKCRAAYDVLEDRSNLQLNIRCASDSYNFDLRASAIYVSGTIKGSWSEATRNAAGTISGKAEGDRFHVVATGPAFTADLTLVTHGNKQSVTIKSQDKDSSMKGVSITLQRS
jgi:hypothetical protein